MKIKNLIKSPLNVRLEREDEDIEALKGSIKEHELINKIVLRPVGEQFEVIAGQRRVQAMRSLHGEDYELTEKDYVVRNDLSDKDALLLSLSENQHRTELSPMELNTAALKLNHMGMTDQQVARALNIPALRLKRIYNLSVDRNKMPEQVREELSKTDGAIINDRHWDHLRKVDEPEVIQDVVDFIMRKEAPPSEVPSIIKSVQKSHVSTEPAEGGESKGVTAEPPVEPMSYEHKGELLLEESEGKKILRVVGKGEEAEIPVDHYLEYLRHPEKFRCYVSFKLKIKPVE